MSCTMQLTRTTAIRGEGACMGTEVRDIISDVLSACISTADSNPILLKEGNKYKEVHCQLHTMVTMPSGTFKSTVIKSIPKDYCIGIQDYTYPAMVGSIGKTGIVKGYIMKAAGKCLVVDEFHSLGFKARKALLSLTEDQKAVRVLGYNAPSEQSINIDKRINKKKQFMLQAMTKDNEIRIDMIRCTVLLSGIFAPHKKQGEGISADDYAFSSRFIPINIRYTLDEIDDVLLDKRSIANPVYRKCNGGHKFEDWEKFVRCHTAIVKIQPPKIAQFFDNHPQFHIRSKLHLARLFAWASGSNSVIDDWERYVPYIPLFLQAAVTSTLTHSEYQVFNLLAQGLNQIEIASSLNVSEAYISRICVQLRELGLG